MSLQIRQVRPDDGKVFDDWAEVYAAAERFGREETAAVWTLPEMRVALARDTREERQLGFAGLLDGRVVVAGYLSLSLLDNLHRCDVAVHTLPELRRRGLGTLMLAHLEGVAPEQGRTTVGAEVAWPYAAGPGGGEPAGSPGVAFARACGYSLGLEEVQRTLDLPLEEALLDKLAAEAAPHHAAYTLRSWIGPVPDELVEGWAVLDASLDTEAPTGDLALEPRVADVAAVREREAVMAAQGRECVHTVALDGDGRPAAYTLVVVPAHEPGRGYQWGTLVRRADRGHRLGLAVKVANHRLLQQERPDVHRVVTYNAESNGHMIAVNEQLGFRVTERMGEYQKVL